MGQILNSRCVTILGRMEYIAEIRYMYAVAALDSRKVCASLKTEDALAPATNIDCACAALVCRGRAAKQQQRTVCATTPK